MNKLVSISLIMLMILGGLIPITKSVLIYPEPPYYGNFDHYTLINDDGNIRIWKVNNYTRVVIYNEQTSYWNDISSDVTATNIHDAYYGLNATEISCIIHNNFYCGRFDSIIFPSNLLSIGLYTKGGGLHDYYFKFWCTSGTLKSPTFTTNSSTYKNYEYPISAFIGGGNYDIISLYIYGSSLTANLSIKVDYIYYKYGTNPNDYYEVWEGGTLKYRGYIEPDLNDFIPPTPTPIQYPEYQSNWFDIVVLIAVFIISVISVKVGILSIIGIILDTYLIIQYHVYTSIGLDLFYFVILILSIMLNIYGLLGTEIGE